MSGMVELLAFAAGQRSGGLAAQILGKFWWVKIRKKTLSR